MTPNDIEEFENIGLEEVEEKHSSNSWIVTFADLLGLIITFFVMIFSISSLEEPKWEEISHSLSQRLDPKKTADYTPPSTILSIPKVHTSQAKTDLSYVYSIVENKLSPLFGRYKKYIKLHYIEEDRIIISLLDEAVFAPGQITVIPKTVQLLNYIGDVTSAINNQIEVISYADPTPINTPDFPSNWELSLSRALVIARILKERGYPSTIRSIGRAESTFRYMSGEIEEENRFAISRRIDIVIRDKLTGF